MKIEGVGIVAAMLLCGAAVANDNVVYPFMSKTDTTTIRGAAVAITPRWLVVPYHLLGEKNEIRTEDGWIEVKLSRSDEEFDVALVTLPLDAEPLKNYARLTDGDKKESTNVRVVEIRDDKRVPHGGKFVEKFNVKRVYWLEDAHPGLSGGGVFDKDGHCVGIVTGLLQDRAGNVIANQIVILPARRIWQFLNE